MVCIKNTRKQNKEKLVYLPEQMLDISPKGLQAGHFVAPG